MNRCPHCAAPLVVDRAEPINRYTRTPHRCVQQSAEVNAAGDSPRSVASTRRSR